VRSGWLAAIVATGCGRLAFDARGATNDAGGSDATDAIDDAIVDSMVDARPIDLIPGLLAWYPLDDDVAAGSTEDRSGGGNPALCAVGVSCPSSMTGRVGGAAQFTSAANERLRIPYSATFSAPTGLTIALFANPLSLTSNQSMFGKAHNATATANSWALEFPGAATPQLKVRSGGGDEFAISSMDATVGWVHFAGTWDGATMRFYFNGTQTATQSASSMLVDTNDVVIGCDVNGGTETSFFEGNLDDIRLYNRALTQQEIMLLVNQ
jgi:hypothetical protein